MAKKPPKSMRLIRMIKLYSVINNVPQRQLAKEADIPRSSLQNIFRYSTASESNLLKLIAWSIEQETKPQEQNQPE